MTTLNVESKIIVFIVMAFLSASMTACGGADDTAAAKPETTPTHNNTSNEPAEEEPTEEEPTEEEPTEEPIEEEPIEEEPTEDPTGSVAFEQPADGLSHTNGTIDVALNIEGQATAVELIVKDAADREEVLATWDGTSPSPTFLWDTSAYEEGLYTLVARFQLGGVQRWSFEERRVVVDRTAPRVIAESVADGEMNLKRDTALVYTFDEAIAPNSIVSGQVSLTAEDVGSVPTEPSLDSDLTLLEVDFDRDGLPLPARISIDLGGLTDLAGNAVQYQADYGLPAWLRAEVGTRLSRIHYLTTSAGEFVVGVQFERSAQEDRILIYKQLDDATWDLIHNEAAGEIADLSATTLGDEVFIAVLRDSADEGLLLKSAALYTLNTARRGGRFARVGESVVGPRQPGGAISIDTRTNNAGVDTTMIAAVNGGVLRVLTFNGDDLNGVSPSIIENSPSNVREEGLQTHIDVFGQPEVLYTRCSSDSEPCTRTSFERLHRDRFGEWHRRPGLATTPLNRDACDVLLDSSTFYDNTSKPFLFYTYR
ncbi:MAG: Ig-like domain-containing protein, partial [Myxococcota bacterium]